MRLTCHLLGDLVIGLTKARAGQLSQAELVGLSKRAKLLPAIMLP